MMNSIPLKSIRLFVGNLFCRLHPILTLLHFYEFSHVKVLKIAEKQIHLLWILQTLSIFTR